MSICPPPKSRAKPDLISGMSRTDLERGYRDMHQQLLEQVNQNSTGDSKLLEKLEGRMFSSSKKPPEPKARFRLAGVPICTPGNLTTIAAQEKAGKTAAITAMIASAFGKQGNDFLSFDSENPSGHAIVHIDTEQSTFDHWEVIHRAGQRARASIPSWLMSYCVTGLSAKEIRGAVPLLLDEAREKFGGVHSLILDGAADAVVDPNIAEESNAFVSELHALAIQYDCPIVCVIHLNPGSDFKTRGHLGSQLGRKSETNLRVEKDEDEVSTIWADKNRRKSIPKKTAPCFAWNDKAHMHLSVENPAEAKAEAKQEAHRATMAQDAQVIFAQGKTVPFKEALSSIEKHFRLQRSGARRRLETWEDAGIIERPEIGFYALAK